MADSDFAVESGTLAVVTEMETEENSDHQQDTESVEKGPDPVALHTDRNDDGSQPLTETLASTVCNLSDMHTQESTDMQSNSGVEAENKKKKTLIVLTADKMGQFHCSECDVWAQGHAFEEHIVCHILSKPYQCLYCSQCFISRRQVSRHVQKDHTGQKMNCALKALKKVKAMMRAARQSGKHQFYASVPGKVPLVRRSSKITEKLKASKTDCKSSSCSQVISEEGKQCTGESLACDTAVSDSKSSSVDGSSSDIALENLSSDSQEQDDSNADVNCESSQDSDVRNQDISCEILSQTSDGSLHNLDSSFKSDDDKLTNSVGDEIPLDEKSHESEKNCRSNENMVVSCDGESFCSEHLQNDHNDKPDDNFESNSVDKKSDSLTSETSAAETERTTSELKVADLEEKSHKAPDAVTEADSDTSLTSRLATKQADAETLPNRSAEGDSLLHNVSSDHSSDHVEEMDTNELSTEHTEKKVCSEAGDCDEATEEEVCGVIVESLSVAPEESQHSDQEPSITERKDQPEMMEQDGPEPGPVRQEFLQANFNQSEESTNGTGLKIVAAFSLQEEDSQIHDGESEEKTGDEKEEVCSEKEEVCSEKEEVCSEKEEVCSEKDPQEPDRESVDSCSTRVFPPKDSQQPADSEGAVDPGGLDSNEDSTLLQPTSPPEPQTAPEPTSTPEPQTLTPEPMTFATPEPATAPLALGPPSKPDSSSSFLDLPPNSSSSLSGGVPGHQLGNSFHFFVCGFSCGFSCLTTLEFRDHLMLDHAGEVAFRCHHCGYQSISEDGLIRHIAAHAHTYSKSVPLYICGASACKFGSNLIADFLTHQSTWHPDLTIFHCHDCDESFASVEDLLKHFEANFLHIINCPYCSAKTTERRTLLNHIAAVHPGKPKMVSVAKQIVCRDRKLNSYSDFMRERCQGAFSGSESWSLENSGACEDQKSDSEPTGCGGFVKNKCLLSILKEPIEPQEQELTSRVAFVSKGGHGTADGENEGFEDNVDEEECGSESRSDTYSESLDGKKDKLDFKCNFCTFVARDPSRLEGHERGHSLPASKKTRFKCMYCPQSFNCNDKFHSHVTCHPGLIRFTLFQCRQCSFDSNQRHIIVKHARGTHDRKGQLIEEDLYTSADKTLESRVLECYQCSYMTRHRKHLVAHVKGKHANTRKMDYNLVRQYASQSARENSGSIVHVDLNQQLSAAGGGGGEGTVKENSIQRFKCPICQYLLPRPADLQAHVKRHSEIGQITLVMFRCKYCSSASTSREVVYGHLMEKHMGREVAMVKKIVKIDTHAEENGYAVTSVDDGKDCDAQKPAVAAVPEQLKDQMVLVIPDSTGEILQSCMQCPRCTYSSSSRKSIIAHVCRIHPDVRVMGRDHNNEVYPLNTLSEALKGEILIVPDNPSFEEAALCPKCDFTTHHRRSMVQHLDENHPEVSVMGRNDYPSFESKDQAGMVYGAGGDGMIVIGSGSLDEKISCLYEHFGDGVKCKICNVYRPKKFFIHLHILRHLNILLWSCRYCSHRGLQKYKMIDHIKKVHPGRAYCVSYQPANVEEKVSQFLQSAAMAGAEDGDASSNPDSVHKDGMNFDRNKLHSKHPATQSSFEGCVIGSDELDMKLACLYSVGSDGQSRCVVCGQVFQRKYAIHRHLVQNHLQVNLIGCGYCEVEGVERQTITDHILEAHHSATLSMRNLAHNLQEKVTEFLGNMTVSADPGDDDLHRGSLDCPQLSPAVAPEKASRRDRRPSRTATLISSRGGIGQKKNQLNPNLLLLGKDSLHKHLQVMYKVLTGPVTKFKCLVCQGIFDRKYAIHRHLLLKHLRTGIIGCPYCAFQGVERYQVFSHIKEEHKGAELRMLHLPVDLDTIVSEYMWKVNNGDIDPNARVTPPWSMKKTVKKEMVEEEGGEELLQPCTSAAGIGLNLVVAMFGDRRSSSAALHIKKEPMEMKEEEEYEDPPQLSLCTEERDNSGEEEEDAGERDRSQTISSGSKTKLATDMQTSIRVIVTKEREVKRFTCEACAFTSLHRSNVARHIYRVHEGYRLQRCPLCNYRTLSKVMIKQHLESEHPGAPIPDLKDGSYKRKPSAPAENKQCTSAKMRRPSASTADSDTSSLDNTETQQSSSYACAECSFETLNQNEMVEHVQNQHSAVRNEAEDQTQDPSNANAAVEDTHFANLASKAKMNQLNLSEASEDYLLQCFYCSYKTSQEEDLKIHFSDYHPMNPFRCKKVPTFRFVCRSCRVKTRAASKMRYHLNRHINYRPYTCTTCGSFYPSPDQCRKHCRANSHSETFTYMKVASKEARLRELLQESQKIAIALIQNSGDVNLPDPSFAVPVMSRRRAKKSFPSTSTSAKLSKMEFDSSGFAQDLLEDENKRTEAAELMACTKCDFSAQSVCEVRTHFLSDHPDEEFLWLDSTSGHVCKETGDITNAKDVPPEWEMPPDSGYIVTGSGLLSCRHCEFSTTSVQACKSHVKRHLPKRYLCPYCSMRCSRLDTVNLHVRCAHSNRERWTIFFQVPDESPAATENEAVDNSDDSDEPQVSFQEEDREAMSPAASSSGASDSSPAERIGCGHCDVRQDCVADAFQHHSETHPDLPFLWMDCSNGYSFNFLGEVVDAKKETAKLFTKKGSAVNSDGQKLSSFRCQLCPFRSAYIQAIKSHMKSHQPHGFMCPYCCMTTSSKEKMVSHQSCAHKGQENWVMHLRMSPDSPSSSGVVSAREKNVNITQQARGVASYSCNDCDFCSESLYQYRQHLATHGNFTHLVHHIPDDDDDLSFECHHCHFTAQDEDDFNAHVTAHAERQSIFGARYGLCNLVDFDPEVKVVPVNDLDLDREGLRLFSPPSSSTATSR